MDAKQNKTDSKPVKTKNSNLVRSNSIKNNLEHDIKLKKDAKDNIVASPDEESAIYSLKAKSTTPKSQLNKAKKSPAKQPAPQEQTRNINNTESVLRRVKVPHWSKEELAIFNKEIDAFKKTFQSDELKAACLIKRRWKVKNNKRSIAFLAAWKRNPEMAMKLPNAFLNIIYLIKTMEEGRFQDKHTTKLFKEIIVKLDEFGFNEQQWIRLITTAFKHHSLQPNAQFTEWPMVIGKKLSSSNNILQAVIKASVPNLIGQDTLKSLCGNNNGINKKIEKIANQNYVKMYGSLDGSKKKLMQKLKNHDLLGARDFIYKRLNNKLGDIALKYIVYDLFCELQENRNDINANKAVELFCEALREHKKIVLLEGIKPMKIFTDKYFNPNVFPQAPWHETEAAKHRNISGDTEITIKHGGGFHYLTSFLLYKEKGYHLEHGGLGIQVAPIRSDRETYYANTACAQTLDRPVIFSARIKAKYIENAPNGYEAGLRTESIRHLKDVQIIPVESSIRYI